MTLSKSAAKTIDPALILQMLADISEGVLNISPTRKRRPPQWEVRFDSDLASFRTNWREQVNSHLLQDMEAVYIALGREVGALLTRKEILTGGAGTSHSYCTPVTGTMDEVKTAFQMQARRLCGLTAESPEFQQFCEAVNAVSAEKAQERLAKGRVNWA